MKYTIEITGGKMWRYGQYRLNAGLHRVPEDVTDELALIAIKEGAAVKISKKSAAPENKALRNKGDDNDS